MEEKIIKFRGKRLDNNEWVYGYYFESHNYHFILPFDGIYETTAEAKTVLCNLKAIEVAPETLGQYIEHEDRNNKEIYDGDDIVFHSDDGDSISLGRVRYFKEWSGWCIWSGTKEKGFPSSFIEDYNLDEIEASPPQ